MRTLLLLVAAGCAGDAKTDDGGAPPGHSGSGTSPESTPTTDTDPSGACGSPVNYDVVVLGLVETPTGAPADATTLALEDRGWQPGRVLGTATTDAYGAFTLQATAVTSLEDCWGTVLNYVLTAERAGPVGAQTAELGVNTPLYNAIQDGSLEADLGGLPITLREAK